MYNSIELKATVGAKSQNISLLYLKGAFEKFQTR